MCYSCSAYYACYTGYETHPLTAINIGFNVMRVTHLMRVFSTTPIPRIIFVPGVMHIKRVRHVTRAMSPNPFSLRFFF